MSWLTKNIKKFRFALSGLLVVAIIAPWGFDNINVPAQYACASPNIRLEGDFCGLPLSGLWMLTILMIELFRRIGMLFIGAPVNTDLRSLFFMTIFPLALLLPILSTYLITRRVGQPRWRVFHLAAWGGAAVVPLIFNFANSTRIYWELWGLWLYLGLAVVALTLETIMLIFPRKSPEFTP